MLAKRSLVSGRRWAGAAAGNAGARRAEQLGHARLDRLGMANSSTRELFGLEVSMHLVADAGAQGFQSQSAFDLVQGRASE